MTPRLDSLVREVIRELAAEAPPPAATPVLARTAIRRARAMRRRRVAAVAGSVAAVVVLALLTPYALRLATADGLGIGSDPSATPSAAPPPSAAPSVPTHVITDASQPIPLVDGFVVIGNLRVLDVAHGTYTAVDGDEVYASPNGRWAAAKNNAVPGSPYRVIDLATGESRDYPVVSAILSPQWSPDGNRLLFTVLPKGGSSTTPEMHIIDVTTGDMTVQPLSGAFLAGHQCVYCGLSWLPSGTEVALGLGHNVGEAFEPQPDGVQVFTLDGKPSRRLGALGVPGGPGAWSPDGRYVMITGASADLKQRQNAIVDAATGEVVASLALDQFQVAWVDQDRILVWENVTIDGQSRLAVTLRTVAGPPIERWVPPAEIVGRPRVGNPSALCARIPG